MRTRTLAGAFAALAVVAAMAIPSIPAAASTPTTGTVVVQLIQPGGAKLTTVDASATIELSNEDNYFEYSSAATQPSRNGTETYNGAIVGGKVTFTGVPSGNSFTLEVSGNPAYIDNSVDVSGVKGGTTLNESLSYAKFGSISGTVTVTGGDPLANAAVSVVLSDGEIPYTTTTDASGNYSLSQLYSGSYRIQFNSHSQLTGATTANLSDTWSYWKNTSSYTKLTKITVYQQSSSHVATILTGVNAVETQSFPLTLKQWVGTPAANFAYQNVIFRGSHAPNTVVERLNSAGTQTVAALNKGSYTIEFISVKNGVSTDYWYTGENKKPTTSKSKAKTFTWTNTSGATVDFGVGP
jgi:hypothetical protein